MAEDVPAFDDIPSFDDLPDAPGGSPQAAQSAVPAFDDIPNFDDLPQAEGTVMSAARSGANAILPGAAALSGFGAGAELAAPTAPFTYGIGPVVGGLVGAGIAAYGASKLQDVAKEAVGLDDTAQRALNAQEHPIASGAGEIAGGMAGMGPAGTLAQRAAGAGLQGVIEGAHQVYRGEFDPATLAMSVAGGAALPGVNRVGKVAEDFGRAAARKIPGRPGSTANPAADQAHADVGDPEPVDVHASALAQEPVTATGETTGNPQSAPDRSARDYGKGKGPTEPENDMLSQGDIAPDKGAALKALNSEKPSPDTKNPAPPKDDPSEFAMDDDVEPRGQDQMPAPAPVQAPAPPPAAQAAIAKSKRVKAPLPEPIVEAGFPKEGEPVAVGENEATKMPALKGETPLNDSITEAQKVAGNYPKARTHDFGKPVRVETHAGDVRRGKDPGGKDWENRADYDYGYFGKTVSTDKDPIDFARPPEGSPDLGDKHFIIDQRNLETGKYDEPKVFKYYKDEATARKAYESGFSDGKGAERLGAITEVDRGQLVKYLAKHSTNPPKGPYGAFKGAQTSAKGSAKPGAERAVIKSLVAKKLAAGDEAGAQAILAQPDEALVAASKTARNRNYGEKTGASAGYAVEGIKSAEGKPITANTKIKAQERSAIHKEVENWFADSKPPSQLADGAESNGELLDRIKNIPDKIGGWVPAHKPASWMLMRAAKQVLSKPTPANIEKFRDAERMLRGKPEDVDNYRGGNRIEADIARSKRSGDEAVATAEAKNLDLGRNSVEDDMIAAIDAKRGGRFDVPHEEAETMVEPKPVKTAADLKELPHKTIDVRDSSLAKIDTKAISKKTLSDADAALVGRKAKANVESEGAASPVRQIKHIDETEKARLMAALNKAASKKGAEVDALPAEHDPDVVPKHFSDLFDKFAGDERGSLDIGKIKADVKRLMNTLTKTTDHKSYIAAESKNAMDDYARSLGEDFQRIRGEDTNHQLRMQQEASKLPKELNNPKALEEIYHAREADSAEIKPKNGAASNLDNLDPALKALYDQHLKPIFDQNDVVAAALRQKFPDRMGADVQHHIQRLRKGDTPEFNMLMSRDDPTSPLYNGLMVNAKSAKDRKFYALERVSDGRRTIISPTDKGFNTHIKGKLQQLKDPNFEFEANKPYKAGPVDYVMRQATTKEIERHALDDNKKPMEFYHNAGFSAATTNLQLGSMLRHLEALEAIKNHPDFQKNSARVDTKKATENGYEEPNLPNFKGTAVHPAIKAALDDYAGTPQSAIRRLSAAVTKTLFWMPTAHIDNVGAHWFSARGFDNFTPQGMKRLMQTAPEAFKSVINQDAYQMKMRENGAGLIYGGVLTRDPVQKMARVFQMDMKANPSKYGVVADKLGVPLKSLTGAIYDNASKVMWSVNDVLLTQRVMELEKQGKSMKQAIIDAERDIPNYRLPIKIMGSRWLQKQLADPVKVAFGRYHYGMFNSYANQFKDLLGSKATPGDRLEAAGRLMATGMLLTVIYPMIWDKGAQLLTGNPEAKAQRRGPASIPDKINDALHGKTDVMAAARSSLTLPPLTTTALETLQNRDFRGKPIVEPGDVAGTAKQKGRAALQFGAHIAKGLVSPLSTISTNAQKDISPLGAVRDQATDVKNPSKNAVKYERLIGMHNQRDTVQRFKKGGADPIEGLYNKLFGYK